MGRFKTVDLNRVKTVSLKKRASKAETVLFARPANLPGADKFFDSLPRFLKASDLKEFILRVSRARGRNYPFHLLLGAHNIKVGLSPLLIDLMERKIVTGISLNSAGLIHDLEIGFAGKTSEDVSAGLADGSFGMADETGRMFGEVVKLSADSELGLGEAAGKYMNRRRAPFRRFSLLAAADRLGLPATVHLAVGTDIVCQQKHYKAGDAAEASFRDFKILAEILIQADRGGAVANIGSAVILPEVFLKALTVARNLKKQKCDITTANFDMLVHYRPTMNVVKRPTEKGGKGFNFVGHHEIMVPLLAWGLKANVHTKK